LSGCKDLILLKSAVSLAQNCFKNQFCISSNASSSPNTTQSSAFAAAAHFCAAFVVAVIE
jgi:hypothetical protein